MKKLTLILTILSALGASALAVSKSVTNEQNIVESDTAYDDATSNALTVTGGTYHGTDIALSAATDNRRGVYATSSAKLELNDTAIDVSGNDAAGAHIQYGTMFTFNNLAITVSGSKVSADGQYVAAGLRVWFNEGAALVSGTNLNVTTLNDNVNGIQVTNGTVLVDGGSITTFGIGAKGLMTYASVPYATVQAENMMITTHGDGATAVTSISPGTYVTLVSDTIATFGVNASGLYVAVGATLEAIDTVVNTSGVGAIGALVGYEDNWGGKIGDATLLLKDNRIETTGAAADGLKLGVGVGVNQTVVVDGGRVMASEANGIGIAFADTAGTTSGSNTYGVFSGTYDITVKNQAVIQGKKNAVAVGTTTTGTDGVTADVPTTVMIHVEDGSSLTGGIIAAGTADLTVDVNGSSALNGNVTASGSSAVNLTLSDSTLLGDIAQNDKAVVTIILDDSATGRGGYNGGNLITGSDSTWIFTKDSHGNYGENNGTWNISDYEVIFDNMTHTGTLNINVNTDTGAGGSITITGTADGEGKVHIDTTGNGQLNPNDVLPGIVSGDGTDHWQWDPIDWGIDTIIKDGDHFIKQGTSPAGAVLNSAIAVQQAMWFAQQNSLLKRMGELRYGARASRPLADKDVRVPYHSLIDNIWIRSYGQQLNIGSKVAGRAYEQLIYGVDLGTDHKFTLSADSDLYLGVYAGYGRSDLDYRIPGADGEINSYYGGLYATWLHSSGFYIDATFKAASVDNDLKAPYGNTQLKASYSDVNLGGSIEIGKKFTFADDWFIEPQFQVNYLHILAENYTAGPMTISAQDLDALQLRIGSLFGRTIKLTNSGALQPYIKVSGVETISTGGAIRNGYQHTRANTDGARAELGAGLIWQLDTNNQLHLDYEASFGDKYDKPWGLSAGYWHQF
ncbi:MAG: autotransporter outer membrane beta-barrel domain-containing protein [Verrucomicrobiales bacterium]|jgi:outer membrane autotransporter protein|nr:autotransporter outer membrane beta-barrel domain-containing protein [Verrucomicrobiales bacterium]